MKYMKTMALVLAVLPCSLQATLGADVITGFLNSDMGKIATAAGVGALLNQGRELYKGANKTLNPIIAELREATENCGPAVAAGLRVAGISAHVKLPRELNVQSARAGFKPFFVADCDLGYDQAVVNPTEADKEQVVSIRAGLGENCKVEVKANLTSVMWAAGGAATLVVARIAMDAMTAASSAK